MDEKTVKKLSLKLFKIQMQLEGLNDEKLKLIIKDIESLDKEILKENNVKFSSKMKKEIIDFM